MVRCFVTASLALNVVVLVPVCISLIARAQWIGAAYGGESPARGILLAVYGAILLASAGLLVRPVPAFVAALLAIQIVYKLLTAVTVGPGNPVAASNIAIAAFHALTLGLLLRRGLPL